MSAVCDDGEMSKVLRSDDMLLFRVPWLLVSQLIVLSSQVHEGSQPGRISKSIIR